MESQINRANRPDAERQAENAGLVSHLKAILEVFRNSSRRGILLWFGAGLALVVGATVYGQIRLNAWSRPFYDALSRKDLSGFASQLFVFIVIAGALLVLNVAQTWLNQMTKVTLREELTRDLFAQWLSPGRAFLLAGAGEVGVNPDQRIHEDARHLAELSTDLCVGLFQATLLLTSFVAILWFLSTGVAFEFEGAYFVVPGYMVWCALFYSGVASWASWRVGRPLVQLNAERYARESDLRFALVHVNEHNEGIAVHRGEAEEKTRLQHALDSLVVALRGLVSLDNEVDLGHRGLWMVYDHRADRRGRPPPISWEIFHSAACSWPSAHLNKYSSRCVGSSIMSASSRIGARRCFASADFVAP